MNNKRKTVILCESYASIAYLLYLLENKKIDVPLTIFIPTLKDLYQLFRVLNEKVLNNSLELIYYPGYKQRWAEARGLKKLLYVIPDILAERRCLRRFYNRYFTGMENADILFPSPGYSGAKIYVLKRLARKNRLVFIDPGPPHMSSYSPRNLREIAALCMYKALYGKEVCLGQFPPDNPWSEGFLLMSESFMKKSIKETIDWSDRAKIMESFPWGKYEIFNASKYKAIYFHQDWVGRYVPDRDTFSSELNEIFKIVLRYYSEEEIARKYHPAHELNKDVVEVGDEIPIYIPSQMIYNEKVEILLGISSSAIANVRGGQAISIINLISLKDESIRERFKENLINTSRTEILFPTTLDEFEKMIIDISGKENGKV